MTTDQPDLDALLNGAVRRTKTVPVCFRGDLRDRYDALAADIADRKKAPNLRVGDERLMELQTEIEAVQTEAEQFTRDFVLREVPPVTANVVMAKEKTQYAGNLALVRVSVIDPEISDAQWEKMFGEDGLVAGGDVIELIDAATDLAFTGRSLPKRPAGSGDAQGS